MDNRRQGATLADRVAVVTGASRGGGRAIAAALGEAGATVYVTGRSTRDHGATDGLPGTIEEAAEEVTARGGRGVAVRVDHTDEGQVRDLFSRLRVDEGRLDLLVNNAWGGYEQYDEAPFDAPFWEQPLGRWDRMFAAGVRAAALTGSLAAPLLIARSGGLIINTVAWAFGAYLGSLFYDTAKAAIVRMAFGMTNDLRPYGCGAVALAPGFMRTERVLAVHAREPFPLEGTESPWYLARAVVALASDPRVAEKWGSVLTAGELAREYGFTDIDGSQPAPFRMPEAT